jgi:hypothetical protein
LIVIRAGALRALSISAKLFTCRPAALASTLEMRGQRRLPVVDVPDGADVEVRLVRSNFCLAIPFLPLLRSSSPAQ